MKKRNNILLFLALMPHFLFSNGDAIDDFIQPGEDDIGVPPPPGEQIPVDMYVTVMMFLALCYCFYIYNKIAQKNT